MTHIVLIHILSAVFWFLLGGGVGQVVKHYLPQFPDHLAVICVIALGIALFLLL